MTDRLSDAAARPRENADLPVRAEGTGAPVENYMDLTAPVFNIQSYSIHDGPGIRVTVFVKGCPLRCRWCANPESNLARPQLMFYAAKCKNAWLAIINYEKGKKNDKAAMRNNHIDEDYERRAKKALFWFAMGLLSLLLYVVVTFIFNMLQKYDNDTYAEEILIFALCLPFFWFGGDWIYYQTQRFCIRLNLQNKYDDKNIPNNFQDKKQKALFQTTIDFHNAEFTC